METTTVVPCDAILFLVNNLLSDFINQPIIRHLVEAYRSSWNLFVFDDFQLFLILIVWSERRRRENKQIVHHGWKTDVVLRSESFSYPRIRRRRRRRRIQTGQMSLISIEIEKRCSKWRSSSRPAFDQRNKRDIPSHWQKRFSKRRTRARTHDVDEDLFFVSLLFRFFVRRS